MTTEMLCMGCTAPQNFSPSGEGDFVCDHCGWCQISAASGAFELCVAATWHSLEAYNKFADFARLGGYEPPAVPPYFSP